MRHPRHLLPLYLLASVALAPAARAQNPAPVSQNTQVHVPAARANKAGADAAAAAKTEQQPHLPPNDKPVVLDSVVAIINGDVILQSDVEQERRFESLQLLAAGENTNAHAADALITRTLILQQMKEEGQTAPNITDKELNTAVDELKQQQPGCTHSRCASDPEWAEYLRHHGLTPQQVRDHWKQRLVILNFLNVRFRSGVRIPAAQSQAYYEQNLVPQFRKKGETPPSFKSLQPRIQEVLLQQQVSKQIDQWETLLRQEGTVEILVPAYGKSSGGDNDEDLPGGGL